MESDGLRSLLQTAYTELLNSLGLSFFTYRSIPSNPCLINIHTMNSIKHLSVPIMCGRKVVANLIVNDGDTPEDIEVQLMHLLNTLSFRGIIKGKKELTEVPKMFSVKVRRIKE